MSRTKRLQMLLSDLEYKTLNDYALLRQMSMSEILRDYIKSLSTYKNIDGTER
uniref:CopG domain protein DNA-binding domain protein n=1 Tax=Gloeothece verrucosa (strain PCC 7822) TaxID=497965 RepID=E0U7L6_GLOV7|nr:hypothetical protein Cyan7822_1724 [Gloeothece verrucosa PCC 7822]